MTSHTLVSIGNTRPFFAQDTLPVQEGDDSTGKEP